MKNKMDSSELRCVLDDAIKPVSQQVERLKNELSEKTSQQVEMENHLLAETSKQIEKLNHDLFADMRGEMEKIVLAAETQNKDLLAQLRSVDTSVKACEYRSLQRLANSRIVDTSAMINKISTDDMRIPNHYPRSIVQFKNLEPGQVNAILKDYKQPVGECALKNKNRLADFLGLARF